MLTYKNCNFYLSFHHSKLGLRRSHSAERLAPLRSCLDMDWLEILKLTLVWEPLPIPQCNGLHFYVFLVVYYMRIDNYDLDCKRDEMMVKAVTEVFICLDI